MKLTTITFIFAVMTLGNIVNAQNMNCIWAEGAGGGSNGLGNSVSTDPSGNVFLTGSFSSPTITFGATTLTNSGGADILIVKYSPTGTVLWAQSAGGNFEDVGLGISSDPSGNVFVTGYFSSSTIAFGTTTLTSSGAYDVFIVKYSPIGVVLWVKSAGGSSFDKGYSVSTDASGNVFMTGSFRSTSISFGTNNLTNSNVGTSDIFIVKYSAIGSVIWAKSAGGNAYDEGLGVSTDTNGNVIISGAFQDASIAFGTITLTNANTVASTDEIFIVKYSPYGTVLWAKSAGGSYWDKGINICTDASGNIFLTGKFNSPSIAFGTTTITSANNSGSSGDVFIAKYSNVGSLLWANSAGGSRDDAGLGISCNPSGNVYLTGFFNSSEFTLGTTTLTNAGMVNSPDIYIVKYSSSGTMLWTNSVGGSISDYGNSVSTDASGNVFLTGQFSSPFVIGTTTLTNAGLFIAKLGDPVVGANENYLADKGITIYPNPFTTQTTISFSEEQTNTSIKIMDMFGKEIISIPFIQGKEVLIEKGLMKAGIYFVQVIDEKKLVQNKKLVLE